MNDKSEIREKVTKRKTKKSCDFCYFLVKMNSLVIEKKLCGKEESNKHKSPLKVRFLLLFN